MATLRISDVVLMYVLVECSASDIVNELFEIMLDTAPKGEPFQSHSVRYDLECGSFCTKDTNCTMYTTTRTGTGQVECKMFGEKETEPETGMKTYKKADECASSPCENNATCLDLVNAYICTCPCGWSGQRCDVAVRPPAPCTGYVRGYGGHYYRYEAQRMSWQAAHDLCASTPGAYLAEITSQPENDFVYNLIGFLVWLGGRRVSGEWTWSHSGGRLADYTPWGFGRPDGSGECVWMDSSTGRWADSGCSWTLPAVCEHDG